MDKNFYKKIESNKFLKEMVVNIKFPFLKFSE